MRQLLSIAVFVFLTGVAYSLAPNPTFVRQVIAAPEELKNPYLWRLEWQDLNGDKLTDLFMVSPTGNVFLYRQGKDGFPTSFSQSWRFPEKTIWFAMVELTPDPGLEIVFSAAQEVGYYYRQGENYVTTPRIIVAAQQVFAEGGVRWIMGPSTWHKKLSNDIPVVFSDHAVLYTSESLNRFVPKTTVQLKPRSNMSVSNPPNWSAGGAASYELELNEIRYREERPRDNRTFSIPPEEPILAKKMKEIRRAGCWESGISAQDINGDSKEDAILWYLPREMDPKTIFLIYRRRPDGTLPQKPDEVLRCRGIPANWGEGYWDLSPFCDVNGDGQADIVMLEIKNKPMSMRSLLEMITSEGMEWTFTVRLSDRTQGFSHHADCSLDFIALLPFSRNWNTMIRLSGDFNGDDRPDLLTRRHLQQMDVFLSTRSAELYLPLPQLHFDVPARGEQYLGDFNGDKISDMYLIDRDRGEITIFLSQAPANKNI